MEHIVTKKVSPIPRGYRTATTCLTVFNVDSAIAFYQAAFGAELLTRHCGADENVAVQATIKIGNSIIAVNSESPELGLAVQATIKIGNSIIAVNSESPELGLLSPARLGACSQVHLYVDDVDTSWERAVEAGAAVRMPLYDAYWGDRTGILQDGNGYLWSVASKIENVSQEEVTRRARAWYQPEIEQPGEYEIPADVEVPVATMMVEETLADDNVAV
jgi:PhnB protein